MCVLDVKRAMAQDESADTGLEADASDVPALTVPASNAPAVPVEAPRKRAPSERQLAALQAGRQKGRDRVAHLNAIYNVLKDKSPEDIMQAFRPVATMDMHPTGAESQDARAPASEDTKPVDATDADPPLDTTTPYVAPPAPLQEPAPLRKRSKSSRGAFALRFDSSDTSDNDSSHDRVIVIKRGKRGRSRRTHESERAPVVEPEPVPLGSGAVQNSASIPQYISPYGLRLRWV